MIKTNSVKYSGEEQKERDIKRTNEWSKNPFDTTPQNLEKWFMVCKNSPWVIKFWRFKFSEMMTTPCVNIMYTCRVFFPFFSSFYIFMWLKVWSFYRKTHLFWACWNIHFLLKQDTYYSSKSHIPKGPAHLPLWKFKICCFCVFNFFNTY